MGRIAKRRTAHILAVQYERQGKRVYNSAALIDPDGRLVGMYRKVQLEPGEEWVVTAGAALAVLSTRIGRIGIALDRTHVQRSCDGRRER